MKHYKDTQNNIYAYELDGSQDHLILPEYVSISEEEVQEIAKQKQQAAFEALSYGEKRQSEYPSIGDQLDALWKGGQAATNMLALVQAVKAKYPKG